MGEYSYTEREGHVLTVVLNRPERMNALHSPAHFELDQIFNDFEADPDLWVCILTGAGDRAFSAGNDLKFQAKGGTRDRPKSGFGGITERFDRTKPMIAAVNGVAMGGGFEIALACDLIIASENAKFALPEPKVGLAALAGGLNRLPRQIGPKRALGMILTGRHVSPEEGKELGFVNDVVPHDALMNAAMEWAKQICACAPLSIRASKDVVYKSLDSASLQDAMEGKYDSVKAMVKSEDFIEGPKAFAEKRAPNWQGK